MVYCRWFTGWCTGWCTVGGVLGGVGVFVLYQEVLHPSTGNAPTIIPSVHFVHRSFLGIILCMCVLGVWGYVCVCVCVCAYRCVCA